MALDEFSFMPWGNTIPRWFLGTAAPTTGTYSVGDTVWNNAPTAGGVLCFVCTTGGTPGTWKNVVIGA